MSTSTKDLQQPGFFERLTNGENNFPIVALRRRWYGVLLGIIVVCLAAFLLRGFSLGIDFVGGTRMTIPPANGASETSVSKVFEEATGVSPQSTQTIGSGDARIIEVNAERLTEEQITAAREALFKEYQPKNAAGEVSEAAISDSTVSESWGSSITQRMFIALIVFLGVVFLYIAFKLERDMALAAILCLLIDLTVVSGLYALIGLEVSPATVIGLLTILAYSLYDTVVIFDKVQENTAGLLNSTRATYSEQVNLAVNQTIMRSINTSIFSVVPIAALLVVAVGIMGVGTLKDLALVQFIGVIAGTFSSIFFAAPFLVSFKMRQEKYQQHEARVQLIREGLEEDRNVENAESSENAPQATMAPSLLPSAAMGATMEIPEAPAASPVTDTEHSSTGETQKAGENDDILPLNGNSWRPGM